MKAKQLDPMYQGTGVLHPKCRSDPASWQSPTTSGDPQSHNGTLAKPQAGASKIGRTLTLKKYSQVVPNSSDMNLIGRRRKSPHGGGATILNIHP